MSVLVCALALSACTVVDPANTNGVETSENGLKEQLNQLNRSQYDICTSTKYAALQSFNPCSNKDISFAQLADNKKVTPAQRAQMIALYTELDPVYQQITALYKNQGSDDGRLIADARDWAFEQARENRLQLINGKVTWGQYLDRRVKINNTMSQRIQSL